jgi:hypothetical protein
MDISTAWVKPPPQVGGLDHLAVQAPCINIYGKMLPGITNVTDRARYYSFYPWLIWSFDKLGFTRYDNEFVERFRRADVLFTLIAERHALVSDDRHDDHAAATVGSDTLRSVVATLGADSSVRLSDYSLREGAKSRYFKNKLGGLGQYYLGVLRELTILDGDASKGIKYTRQVGQLVAESIDQGINGDLFMSAVNADLVTPEQLDALKGLCPCQLKNNQVEQEVLGKLFFVRDLFYDLEELPRRRTLQSILSLSSLLDEHELELNEPNFRGCIYTGHLPGGDEWPIPETLQGNRQKWAAYARNELLSVAVQGCFHAVLDAYEESGLRLDTGEQIARWYITQPEAEEALRVFGRGENFSDKVKTADDWLAEFGEWSDPDHEVQLAEKVASNTSSRFEKSPASRTSILTASLKVFLALAHRNTDNPYGELVFNDGYFGYYPINLRSFGFHLNSTWRDLDIEEFLTWILTHWGIDIHLRVALRKLRGQAQSTFRIRPSDRGLEVTSVPAAVHTRPRFIQAVRVLKDIGALEESSDTGRWRPSSFGKDMMELGDAP